MPLMQWDAALDIGVEAMNEDHREILDVMNQIHDAHGRGQSGAVINLLVANLAEVCSAHFADEEAYMARIGYPGLASHKIIHQHLLGEYAKHAEAIKANGGRANDEFFGFLRRWLVAHIKGIDAKYGAHAKGAKLRA
ncbi:MAG TPA: hypothetical protein DCL54_01905 [Alphaproteobacteria bacterium]|nr:hypothetical protein [Alphaproteobacteria bacterium]